MPVDLLPDARRPVSSVTSSMSGSTPTNGSSNCCGTASAPSSCASPVMSGSSPPTVARSRPRCPMCGEWVGPRARSRQCSTACSPRSTATDGRPARRDGLDARLVDGEREHVASPRAEASRGLPGLRPVVARGPPGDPDLPWTERRELLDEIALQGPAWQTPAVHRGEAQAVVDAAVANALPGVVLKRPDAIYSPGELSADWLACDLRSRSRRD